MTHEELIEKCQAAAHAVVKYNYFIDTKMKITTREMTYTIISTILTALQEPTEEMLVAGCQEDDPLGGLVDWRGDKCTTREAIRNVFLAALNASPLAGEKRGAE